MNALPIIRYFTASLFSFMLAFQGCKENPIITTTSASLSDPTVQPAVIYTNPPNGSNGPYKNIYNGYDGSGSYHFFVQFNKLMDSYSFSSSTVSIEGFDEEVYIQRSYYYDQYSDIFRFTVYSQSSGQAKFTIGRKYTVRIKSSVQDLHGYTLAGDFVFSFTPEPSFRAVSGYPQETVESGSVAPWIQFNSKVPSSIVSSLKITPQISGNWVYPYGDSTRLSFNPSTDFTLNTPYTIEVLSGAKDVMNNPIASPFSFTFTKKNTFKVSYIYMTQFDQRLAFRISFNGTADTTTIRNAFSISPAVAGKIEFNYSNYDFYFVPDSDLTPGTLYTISITSAVKSSQGIPMEPYSGQVYASDFQIASNFPYQYSDVSRYTSIELRTNYSVDTSTVKGAFSISPAAAGTLIAYKNYIHFVPSQILQANTQYTVSINTSLKTTSGYSLKYAHTYTFKTGK